MSETSDVISEVSVSFEASPVSGSVLFEFASISLLFVLFVSPEFILSDV